MTELRIGGGLVADGDVVLGYPSGRTATTTLVVGCDARLRAGTILYSGAEIGDRFETGHNVVVREESTIGHDVSVWTNSVIDYGCRIGNGVKVHTNCYVAQHSELEDGVFLAPGVSLANDLYPGNPESAEHMQGPWLRSGAQVGVNATVLPYVEIGAGAVIGAGSVVTRDIPAGMVAYGSPAVPRARVDELGDIRDRVLKRARRGAAPDPAASGHRRVGSTEEGTQ